MRCLVFVELIALTVGHDSNADANQHRRDDHNKDNAAERMNESRTRGGRLGVTKGAVLRESDRRHKKAASKAEKRSKPTCANRFVTDHF